MDNENEFEIKTGDFVQVIVSAWDENENPTFKNFYEGKVTEVVERAAHCFYVRLENLDRLIPIDRVIA
jgi:ribosomal protein L21E